MALTLLKRGSIGLRAVSYCAFFSQSRTFWSRTSRVLLEKEKEQIDFESLDTNRSNPSINYFSKIQLSPLVRDRKPRLDSFDIELVDDETWKLSSGLAYAYNGIDRGERIKSSPTDEFVDNDSLLVDCEPDLDDMRVRGNLFYKIDRGSKEFEEYSYDFHKKKSSKRKDDHTQIEKKEAMKKKTETKSKTKTKENPSDGIHSLADNIEKNDHSKIEKKEAMKNKTETKTKTKENPSDGIHSLVENINGGSGIVMKKKLRTPTYNQLTGPYHEPFCLDIYISKESIRVCVVHRVTSKVVVVAHSISKDMKFDLTSTRNSTACIAVGGILAERALADDIHNVIYTPRKGEKMEEGKLQIVLQAVIDNGLNVKVKLKQRRNNKVGHLQSIYT